MTARIDLHIHTTYSDGLTSPAEVLNIAREKRLTAIAICDHDNYGGYFEVIGLLKKDDPEVITGVELSAGKNGEDIHILGYMFDPSSKLFEKALEGFRENRNKRGDEMLSKLKNEGIDIPMSLVREIAGDAAIGRPIIADAMVRVKAIKNHNEAFAKYIGLDGPAYVPKENLNPKEVIELIHKAGGLVFLAHPGVAKAYRHIDEFIDYGLDGIEVHHPYHSRQMRITLLNKAKNKSLLTCGGSDYHGREKYYGMIGSQPVPVEWLAEIKNGLNRKSRGQN